MSGYDPGTSAVGSDFLCLHRNENLLVPSSWLTEISRAAVSADLSAYPDHAYSRLREKLAALHGVDAENVYVSNGVDGILSDLLCMLRAAHPEIAVLDVCFGMYPHIAKRHGYALRRLPGDTFHTGKVVVDGAGLVVVDSPNAVTGVRLGQDVLSKLGAASELLIWDNVYGEFAGDRLPPEPPPRTVILRSFSKYFGLAGARVGYCLASADLVREVSSLRDPFPVAGPSTAMAVAAVERNPDFEGLVPRIRQCRAELRDRLQALGFVVDHESAANFLLARHPHAAGAALQRELSARQILVRRFPGEPTEDHLRITVPPPADIDRLITALEAIVEELSADGSEAAVPMADDGS